MIAPRPWPGLAPGRLPLALCFLILLTFARGPAFAADAAGIAGQVVDPTGRPVPGATVIVSGPLGVRTATADAEGRFAVDGLADATYRVLVEAPGLSAPPRSLRPGSDSTSLELRLDVAPIAESVVVSAAPVPLPRSESPAAISVVSRATLRARQVETLAGVLRTTPGFAVGSNGGRGALTSIFPRGGESDYTLVLVDGIRVNSFGGGMDASLLALGDVEQIEIVRGPQSAVHGADAIGGVVSLRSRTGGAPSAGGQIEAGGQKTTRAGAAVRGSAGAWSAGLAGEHNRSDGFGGIAPATGEQVSNDDWRQALGQAHLEWQRDSKTSLRADLRYLDAERGNPGPYGSNPIGAYEAVDRAARGADTQRLVSLSGRLPWGSALAGRVEQRWQATVAELDNRFTSQFGDSFFETRRLSARTQTDIVLTAETGLTAGVEGLSERARSTFITGPSFDVVPIERRAIGAFAELRHAVGSRVHVTAGTRVDAFRRQALAPDPNPFGPRPAFGVDDLTTVNPRVAARAIVWQDGRGVVRTSLRASFGTGIRPPDAFEIAFTDNPALKPERSRSAEVGISHLVTPRVTVEAAAFWNRYDDLIIAVGRSFADQSRYRTDNIANARARGVEVEASWRGPHGLLAEAAYTWLDTGVLAVDRSAQAPSPFAVGDALLRRPRHQGSLNLMWAEGPATAFATLRARGEVLDIEPSFGAFGGLFTAAGFTVLDAGAGWRLTRQVEVFGRGLNLLGRQYEEAFGFPAPGRLGMVGLRVDLRP